MRDPISTTSQPPADANSDRPAGSVGSVRARELHPGDVVQQGDWPLHICEVTLDSAEVTVEVTEFAFPLHFAPDAEVHVRA